MRRWLFMAAAGSLFLAVPLWGQRGGRGGMAMGGARGGYVAHGGGFAGAAPHPGNFGRIYPVHGPGFPVHPGHPIHYPRFIFTSYPWWAYRGFFRYPWWPGWFGGVGFGWWNGSFSDPSDPSPANAYAPADNSSANIAYVQQQREIDRLNDEVTRLQAERVPATPPPQPQAAEIRAETVLVFRDRHSDEIQNYAIVGETLWVFDQQRASKVPIAQLDVPATTKANADRGIDFRLPGH